MIEGTTTSGFAFKIEDEVFDDYELVEALQEVDEGNPIMIAKVAKLMLGNEQVAELKKHIKGDDKKVSSSKMVGAITEILQASNKGKN